MSTTRIATHVTEAPAGIIRVYVPGADDPEGRKLARSAACRVHGGVSIGATPKAAKAKRGHVYDFAPVAVTRADDGKVLPAVRPDVRAAVGKAQARVTTAAPKVRKAPPREALVNPAELLALALAGDPASREALTRLLAAPAAPAPKAPRVIPAKVQARMDARAAGKATCATCMGHGVVRKAGPRAGQAYRTADGAAAATANGNSAPCPTRHKRSA